MSSSSHPDQYLTVSGPVQGIYKELRSKFISFIYPVTTPEEAEEIVASLKSQYFNAKHHCYAYRIGVEGDVWRTNDAGEPSSTAGKPILGQLLSANLSDVLLVVVRYFGGTKLGIPGLIRAYREAAKDAIEKSTIVEKVLTAPVEIEFPYSQTESVMRILKGFSPIYQEQLFDNNCKFKISLRLGEIERFIKEMEQIENVKTSI
ncbi:MAG: YigZ family protein [Bacteroidales bacterium]